MLTRSKSKFVQLPFPRGMECKRRRPVRVGKKKILERPVDQNAGWQICIFALIALILVLLIELVEVVLTGKILLELVEKTKKSDMRHPSCDYGPTIFIVLIALPLSRFLLPLVCKWISTRPPPPPPASASAP
jgi:hypothetical protein